MPRKWTELMQRKFRIIARLAGFAAVALLFTQELQAAERFRASPSVSTEQRFRPDFVVGGNALTLQMPVQLSVGGYIPRWRFALGYQRQIFRNHWAFVQATGLLDRGDWERFGSEDCGIARVEGICEKGGVAGFEFAAGYEYRFFLQDFPYLVPSARAALGFSRWRYPQRKGSRMQARERAWSLDLRVGAGIRWFLTHQLGVGVDLNIKTGWVQHRDRPVLANAMPVQPVKKNEAFLAFEILPLCGEFRF